MSKQLIQSVLMFLMMCASVAHAEEIVLVVGANSSIGELTKQQAAFIYTGRVNRLPEWGSLQLLDQPEASPVREVFYTKLIGNTAAQAKAYWAKLAFTGRGTPPRESKSSADIKRQLLDNPKLMGYIEKSAIDKSVKVVCVVD